MGKKKLVKVTLNIAELDTVNHRRKTLSSDKKDIGLLLRARNAWETLEPVRRARARNNRFVYGDQWGDEVTVMVDGEKKTISMRDYLCREGNIPQQSNQIKSKVDTIVGVLIKEQNEPVCNAIDRDEQQFGELVTKGLQANNNKNRIRQIYKLCAKDLIIGGIGACHESYGFRDNERRREDSWTKYIDPNYLIIETTLRDPNFEDMTMIGCWYRLPFNILTARFVQSPEDYKKLKDIYGIGNCTYDDSNVIDIDDVNNTDNLTFMTPVKYGECCVAEIWTLETKVRIRVHDWNEGTLEIIDADDKETINEIEKINKERRLLGLSSGLKENEIPYITTESFIDTLWYCRILAPDGTILWEGESPYADGSHPISLMITPFTDGRIAGYITDSIDHQIAINRAIVLQDWIVRNQVKGVVMMPQQLVPDDMENEDFIQNAISLGNYYFYDADKARGAKPEVFHPSAISFDASNYIQQLRSLMESSTAISGALQGKQPYAGTSAALYAQQTANSSTPIASLLDDVRVFMEDNAKKKAKNIAKFYDADRWRLIAGMIDGIFDLEKLNLNEVKDLEFDLLIRESNDTPVYRAIANDYLMGFFNAGAITLEELLTNGSFPFADKLLQSRQARQAEMQAAQDGEMGTEAQRQVEEMQDPVQVSEYGLPVQSTRPIVRSGTRE